MVGQVSTAADALGPLDVWPTQKDYSGPLVDVLGGESGDNKVITERLLTTNDHLCIISVTKAFSEGTDKLHHPTNTMMFTLQFMIKISAMLNKPLVVRYV